MERFAHAYSRALFPKGAKVDVEGAGGGQTLTLAADGVDLAIGAGVYRLVNVVEGVLDALRQRGQPSVAQVSRVPAATRAGCG